MMPHALNPTNLSAVLKAWRGCTPEKPRGTITQREAAEIIGLSYAAIRKVEQTGEFSMPGLLINALKGAPRP